MDFLATTAKTMLRFTTAGSVDDGKSTLIGRLLYDSKSTFSDQISSIARTSKLRGSDTLDLSLLTDGLRAEREQGITIDVAYRYFATPRRKFILADTPGHIEYTRNMVTGASTADCALILIDARHGLVEQTHRHTYLAALLGIPHVVVCVNKMDLVSYDAARYEAICAEYAAFVAPLALPAVHFLPLSALHGEGVVRGAESMPWYTGPTLLELLESLPSATESLAKPVRFPVSYVIRPRSETYRDFRGYAGKLASGILRIGDPVVALPSGATSRIRGIFIGERAISVAHPHMSITLALEDDIDLSRGDVLVPPDHMPMPVQELEANLCWFDRSPGTAGTRYVLRHTTKEVPAVLSELLYIHDIQTSNRLPDIAVLAPNDIAHVRLALASPLPSEPYASNSSTGSFLLIDPRTHATVAAGFVQ